MPATDADAQSRVPPTARGWLVLAVIAAGILAYLVLVAGRGGGDAGTQGPAIGRKLPYLQLEPLTGDARPVSLDDLAGRVTLVNYWGTWCPPCIREFPELVELAQRFSKQDDFRCYLVSCSADSDDAVLHELRAETAAFLQARNVHLPTYADQNASSRRALATFLQLDGFAYPTTLVLDRQGLIRGFWVGYDPRSVAAMSSLVERLLAEPPADRAVNQPTAGKPGLTRAG
jgi:thiol-disulfide isomerase/thioredoxin